MSTENLKNKEAIQKIQDMVDTIKIGMLLTGLDTVPVSAAPMTTKKVDDAGNIWFLSSMNSEHNRNMIQDSKVQLIYSDPSEMEFLSIYGKSEIITDQNILEGLYNKIDDAWFSGKEDPNLSAIKVKPRDAYYWDTKQNKYISLLKMGAAAVTGNNADVGVRGKLDV